MKSNFIHKIVSVGILIISLFSYAQQPTVNLAEQKNLEFQQQFFEALKQKSINNFSKAIESLEKCKQLDTANVAVDFELSKNYLLIKKYFEAAIFIDKALQKEPDNKYLLLHKVAICKEEQNFEKAIALQKELVKKYPNLNDELVLLFIQNQDFNEAESLITEIENNGLKSIKTIGYKAYLLSRKKTNTIAEQQNTIKNVTVESLRIAYEKSKEYADLKQLLLTEMAQQLFENVYEDSKNGLELYPAQPFLYVTNATALNTLEKYNEAITVLTIGIDFVVDDTKMEIDFYQQLSLAYLGIGNKVEAEKFKKKAAQLRN
ncbi:hypothetical protein [Lutibacter sp.]|uniref:tetratricopeptide repeat protein n=1 Tax=Lutibacter sp. TaxID=1925666 RepID=UPI001A33E121|nr:hypothetical protein [Lutibacter sp.]MBI9040816.1 hypothetical protein [Lutibacter sp.]